MTGVVPVMVQGHWWTMITAIYLHGGLLHILFNMLWVRQLGPMVSELFGPFRLFIIFTVSGACGFALSVLMGNAYTLGASGSIFGLLAAAIVFGRQRGSSMFTRHFLQWAIILCSSSVPLLRGRQLGPRRRVRRRLRHRLRLQPRLQRPRGDRHLPAGRRPAGPDHLRLPVPVHRRHFGVSAEVLAFFDGAGRRLGSKTRAEVHRDGDWHWLVFVWCAWLRGNEPVLLLQQRGRRGRPLRPQSRFPRGRPRHGDRVAPAGGGAGVRGGGRHPSRGA